MKSVYWLPSSFRPVWGVESQVIRAYRAMERLPAVALALLAEHEVGAVDEAHVGMVSELEMRRGALLKLVDVHRASLHPTMLLPARCVRRGLRCRTTVCEVGSGLKERPSNLLGSMTQACTTESWHIEEACNWSMNGNVASCIWGNDDMKGEGRQGEILYVKQVSRSWLVPGSLCTFPVHSH